MVDISEIAFPVGICFVGMIFVAYLIMKINKHGYGNKKIEELTELIHRGSLTYLNKQYKVLIIFVLFTAALLFFFDPKMSIIFLVGALFSALAGNVGMRIATSANGRTANACKTSLNEGLNIAFSSGAVMGLTVVSLGLFGIALLYYLFEDPALLYAFGFGASSIALFARVGGGIYTKAADVAADLVGKIEKDIPEDDPRNPAVVADQVGDNVGDVAGMGSDLFESYVGSIIAAMVIGVGISATGIFPNAVVLPLMLASLGIFASIVGTFFVKTTGDPASALNRGIWVAAALMFVGSYFVINKTINNTWISGFDITDIAFTTWLATVSGLIGGVLIGLITEYYTSETKKPVREIAKSAQTGTATLMIKGLATGMMSTAFPVLIVVAIILTSFKLAGLYGIAIAAVGMLSTLGITLAADTYGPVVDNAAGIAEMAKLDKEVRKRAEKLDAVGNTTAAMGKGFAIGSAALTALALFSSYAETAQLEAAALSIANSNIVAGLFIGALLPFVFCAFTMNAVGSAANEMVEEIRDQFKRDKNIMKGKSKPNYEKCISISTSAALREMLIPGAIAILTPIAVALLLGMAALGGVLAGTITTGFLLALMMANAGGAWDNAKKYIEEGNYEGKGSESHKAAVVGDTVGDPFKDTSGPALNILIKLITIIALLIATISVSGIF